MVLILAFRQSLVQQREGDLPSFIILFLRRNWRRTAIEARRTIQKEIEAAIKRRRISHKDIQKWQPILDLPLYLPDEYHLKI